MTLKDSARPPPPSQLRELIKGSGPQKGMCRGDTPLRGPLSSATVPHPPSSLDGQQHLPKMQIPSYPSVGLAQAETSKVFRAQDKRDSLSPAGTGTRPSP